MARRNIGEVEREKILERADRVCHYCGQPIDVGREAWDIDHVLALELGGDDSKMSENLQPIHSRPCHVRKTAGDVAQIAKSKRMRRRSKGIGKTVTRKIPGSKGTGFKARLTSHGTVYERR